MLDLLAYFGLWITDYGFWKCKPENQNGQAKSFIFVFLPGVDRIFISMVESSNREAKAVKRKRRNK
jgi:hypothetical protein